jgi:hypothetical protein
VNSVLDEGRVRQTVGEVIAKKPRGFMAILSHFQITWSGYPHRKLYYFHHSFHHYQKRIAYSFKITLHLGAHQRLAHYIERNLRHLIVNIHYLSVKRSPAFHHGRSAFGYLLHKTLQALLMKKRLN